MYAALKRGEMVTILPDQQPKPGRGAGVFASFFGVPALTMTLFGRLARRSWFCGAGLGADHRGPGERRYRRRRRR